jgi:hypothetical protein
MCRLGVCRGRASSRRSRAVQGLRPSRRLRMRRRSRPCLVHRRRAAFRRDGGSRRLLGGGPWPPLADAPARQGQAALRESAAALPGVAAAGVRGPRFGCVGRTGMRRNSGDVRGCARATWPDGHLHLHAIVSRLGRDPRPASGSPSRWHPGPRGQHRLRRRVSVRPGPRVPRSGSGQVRLRPVNPLLLPVREPDPVTPTTPCVGPTVPILKGSRTTVSKVQIPSDQQTCTTVE